MLVPRHALLCELYNAVSTETLFLLGMYADISDYSAQTSFYTDLYTSLSDFILSFNECTCSSRGPPQWKGCLAAGDWNFVESDSDCFPFKAPSFNTKRCRKIFNDIKTLCLMADAAGNTGSFRKHTFTQNARGIRIFSRLDQIYFPPDGWTASTPIALCTNHSDHHFVWADCFISSPCVELAVPAPRLPPIQYLDEGLFWPTVLSAWTDLTTSGVSLPTWSSFKKVVLSAGLSVTKSHKTALNKNWKSALRGDKISSDQLDDIVFKWNESLRPHLPRDTGRHPWRSAVEAYDSIAPQCCPRKYALFPDALGLSPLLPTAILDEPAPVTPVDISRPAPITYAVPDMLDRRIAAKRASQLHKYREMECLHTSAWYNLSSNKEADERGSRTSVSVEGLRRNVSENATTDLKHMLHIAHQHFAVLHTPRTMTTERSRSQFSLLSEIATEYGPKPGPSSICSGDFSIAEFMELRSKMPNTAPGPDGIQYGFYKALASKLDFLISSGHTYTSFWDAFHSLANDIRSNGSNHCNFKLANLSLFYKKGDPTLVSNYRPISSMNTDCKMYTNLINGHICPWAVKKIHSDQAGFVPGRLITDHTRLASEVAHLANTTGVDGYIVSLDQAKAYDCTDLSWLLRVLSAMGIPEELISLIDDVTSGC